MKSHATDDYKQKTVEEAILLKFVEENNADLLETYLESEKPNLNYSMQHGETLLMRAIKKKHMPVAQILVSYGANVNYPGVVEAKFIPVKRITYPIHQAVASESIEFTEWLIKNGACINEIFYEEETYQSKKSRFFSPKVTRATALDIAYNHNATLIIKLLEDNHAERYRTTRLGCLPMCC